MAKDTDIENTNDTASTEIKSTKKLKLSRETIRSLEDAELDAAVGGCSETNGWGCCSC